MDRQTWRRSRDSCRKMFLNLEILSLPSQYILSLLLFVIRNKIQFQVNFEIYQSNTRQHANLHQTSVNAISYQKGVHCIGFKVFNMLPFYIKAESDNPKKIKAVLQKYLLENSLYSLDECFELQSYYFYLLLIFILISFLFLSLLYFITLNISCCPIFLYLLYKITMWLLYTLVLMSTLNPNKYDDFHIHMDYVILYGFTEGK